MHLPIYILIASYTHLGHLDTSNTKTASMASAQPPNNDPKIEKVHYDPKATAATHDTESTALVPGARRHLNGTHFNVTFDPSTPKTCASDLFMARHFPSDSEKDSTPIKSYVKQPPSDLWNIVLGYADITIYIPGHQEIPHGLRVMGCPTEKQEGWFFQFNLRVRVVGGPGGRSLPGLIVGSRVMACFDLALRESSLVLRADKALSSRRVMRCH